MSTSMAADGGIWRCAVVALLFSGCHAASSPRAESHSPDRAASSTPTRVKPALDVAASSSPAEQAPPKDGYSYRVRFAADLSSVDVRLCAPKPMAELQPSSPGGKDLLAEAQQGSAPCRIEDGVAILPHKVASCVRYRVNLQRMFVRAHGMNGALRLGAGALLSPDLWLWTPEPRDSALAVYLKLDMPKGMSVTLPWQQAPHRWSRVPESSFVWKMQGAVGRVRQLAFPFPKGELVATLLQPEWGARTPMVLDWLKRSTRAVSDALGGMPSRRVQVILVPQAVGSYGFGYATRGGGDVVALLVKPSIRQKELSKNWMAVHELLHFSLPTMGNEHAWLYEGLVTYLAAVVRAKTQMVSPSFAWGELLDGFVRGSGSGTGVSLAVESANMLKTGSFWRVYWWGALVALEWDVALHRKGKSLLGVLRKLQRHRFERVADYSAEEVLTQMDRIAEENIFVASSRRHLKSLSYPNYARLAQKLGLRLRADQTAAFNDRAPFASIRKAITQAMPADELSPSSAGN